MNNDELIEYAIRSSNAIKEEVINLSKEVGRWNSYYDDEFNENLKLKHNWNELKEWLKKELGDRINPNKDKWLTGVYDAYRETIDKMQELEQGSDE